MTNLIVNMNNASDFLSNRVYTGFVRSVCFISIFLWCLPLTSQERKKPSDKVLIFSKTKDYRHESTEFSIQVISELCRKNGIHADATEDATWFSPQNLKKYAAIIFLNSSGDVFDENQENAFQQYMRSGGGFVGIHGASTTEYTWEWFGKMVGAYFAGHPEPQEATLIVHDTDHLSTRELPEKWRHFEEWYNFRWVDQSFNLLMSVDETTYHGGRHPEHHPVSWYKPFEGGRVFYTALGHGETCYRDVYFLKHVLGGIRYAMGEVNTEVSRN